MLRHFKPYPAYKDSGIEWLGEIPAVWVTTSLKRIASIRYGLGEPPAQLANGLPFIRATNISKGKIIAQEMQFVDPEDVPWERDPVLRSDDIIVVRSGAYTGDSAIIPLQYDGAIAGYDMVVRPRRGSAPQFIAWALLSGYLLDAQIKIESLRAAQPHLNAEELGTVIVLLPPGDEQRAIAAFLQRETARIDALVAKKERLIELLQEKRAAIIASAVTKGLDLAAPMKNSRVEWLGAIPGHWAFQRVRRIVHRIEQGWSPSCENREAGDGEWGVLKAGCANNGRFAEKEHKALPPTEPPIPELEIRGGDVLMSRASGSRELVGSVAVVPECRPRLLLCDKVFRLYLDTCVANKYFFALAMNSQVARSQIEIALSGGSGLANNIPQEVLRDIILPMPAKEEQNIIVEFVNRKTDKIDALVETVRPAVERLKELRTALITAAVTGKIDVRGEAA